MAIYGLAVLIGGFLLLTVLAMRGKNIFVVAPFCALLVLALSGANPIQGLTGPFMEAFAGYVGQFYLVFALGAAFGKLCEQSRAADAVARQIVHWLGPRWACLSVVLACAVLTYGGVSLFVVGFSVYPLAVQLFREADLPRRFIPAAIAFGSVTFTMTSAGSPEIQNLIPLRFLLDDAGQPLSDARAGWPVSLIVAVVMFGLGQAFLEWELLRARRHGEKFESRATDAAVQPKAGPGPTFLAAVAPLLATLLALNALPVAAHWLAERLPAPAGAEVSLPIRFLRAIPEDASLAIFLGVVTGLLTLRKHLHSAWTALGEGFMSGLLAIGSTASVVGFGGAIRNLPAFQNVVAELTRLPFDPLLAAAIAIAVISGLAGSASGGQGIAWPLLKPVFIDQLGVAPRALHRVVAISSGTLDTLPANGYLVMLIRHICGETHGSAYWPICVTCTLLPILGTALAILLFQWFPSWAQL